MRVERSVSRTWSFALRTRLVRAGAAVAAALAVATCGGDSPTEVTNLIAFAVQPTNSVAGVPISSIRVEIRNSSGTVVTSFSDNVTLAITTGTGTGGAVLSGTTTVAAVNGVATFNNLSINRSGTAYRLTASTTTLAAATSSTFNIAPGPMSDLAFTVEPSAATAGTAIAPAVQVTARDAFGNTATGFTGSVTIAIGTNPAGGVLSGTTSVNAVAGMASFATLSINKSAPGYTLTASTAGPPIVTETSVAFTVSPGAAAALSFSSQPSNATAGAAFVPAVAVTALDAQGNVATGFAGAVTLAIGTNPAGGTLGGTTTVGAVNGVATFNSVNVNRAGTGYTLSATAGALDPATSSSFDIAAGVTAQLAFTVQPFTVTAGVAIAPAVVVQAQDAAGNLTPSYTGDVTISIVTNAGGGALTGTVTAAAIGGVATFADLVIDKSGTGYTLGAAAGGLAGATSAGFNVVAGAAATIAFSVDPVTTAAGSAIAPAVQVTAFDALGNVATGFTDDVTVALGNNPSGGVLSGTATLAAVAGVATFADLTIDKVGAGYTLTATSGALPGATSAAFDITAGAPAVLAFTVEPTAAVAGAAIAPAVEVTARDAQGNVATGFTGDVTLAIGTNPGGGTLSGAATAAAVAGVATFADLSIDRAGTGYTLSASSGTITGTTSAAFDIAVGAVTQVVFTVQPSAVVAGASISPAVEVAVQDALGNTDPAFTGNVTVAIANNAGSGTLSGTATVAAVAGVATFADLSIDKAGASYTLEATSGALTAGTSAAFDVGAGAATQLVFAVQPSAAGAGLAISPAVQVSAQDAFGNIDPSFAGDVTVAIGNNAGNGTLSGTATAAAAAGVATFADLSIDKSGVGYTLTAASGALTGATSAAFDVLAGLPALLEFTVQPTSATAGAAISPAIAVTARDGLGNVATDFTGNVTLALQTNPGGGTLTGTTTQAAVAGVATFNGLSIDKVGLGYTLAATSTAVTGAVSSAFDITVGATSQLVFTVEPSTTVAGAAISPAVQIEARDALGNLASGFTGDVTVAIGTNAGGGTLSGTATVAAVGGVASLGDLSIDKVGVGYTLAASSGALTGATSAAFDITPGTATQLAFAVQPAGAVAGVAIAPAVQVAAQDAFGNVDPSFTGDVTVAIANNAGGGTLSGTFTVGATAGVASFADLSIDKTGAGYTLGATAGSLTAATSAGFTITAAVATTIEFGVQPSSAVAGAAIAPPIEVMARDAFGNVATGFTGTVTLAIANNAGGGALSGSASLAAVAGVATFANVNIDKVGAGYTLQATAGALPAATSAAFDITPGAATQLVFTAEPTSATAGQAIAPSVQVTALDAFGNTDPAFAGDVTVAIGNNAGGGTLSGTATVAAVAGVASFADLSIDKSGTGYTLGATSGALTAATSAGFNIIAGAATALAFTAQPVNTVAGVAIAPAIQVAARDAQGNVDPTFTGNVTVAIGTNPAAGALSGTATMAAVAGVATFADLSIDKAGVGYTLGASSGTLTPATSAAFNITAGVATQLAFSVEPTSAAAGAAITPSVQVSALDAQGNLVTGFTGDVAVAITVGTGKTGAALSGTLTRAAVGGVATFNDVSIDSAAAAYTLTATSNGLTEDVSAAFDITAGAATQLAFTVQPTSAGAGVPISPAVVVVARDAGGNLATGFSGDVTMAITGGTGDVGAALLGSTTVAAVSGVATFSTLNVDSIGTGYTLTATSAPLTAATSGAFNVTPGPAAALVFTGQPSSETVNSVITPAVAVTARDQFGNVATQFASNVTMSFGNNPGGATLNGSVNKAAVNGVATFTNLSITAAGVGYTLAAASPGLAGATSAPFNIDAQVATRLVFSVQPTATTAGAIINTVSVQARDASGTLVPTFTGQVAVAIESGTGGALLTGTLTQTAVGGVASFPGLSIDKSGTFRLAATSTGLADGFSAFFNINPGAATTLEFTVPPSNAIANQAMVPQVQVTARDALGNVVTTYAGPVSLTITPNTGTVGAVLSGGAGITPTNGVASFPAVSINAVGTGYTLDATGTAGSLSATSGAFDVTVGAGSHLQYLTPPSVTVAGSPITPAVQVQMLDGSGVLDPTFTGAVTVALQAGFGSPDGVLSGTTTVNAVAGVATFDDLSVDRTSLNYRLAATTAGAAGTQSGNFQITAGPAARLDVLAQPVTTTAGATMPQFTVRALDEFGNVNSAFTGPVTVAISVNPGAGTLSGTTTVNAINGTATFTGLSIDKSGTGYRLEATSGALTPDVSNAFSITGGTPVRLAFTVQPTQTRAGFNITPIVRVTGFDALDNIATFNLGETVTLTITSGTGAPGAVLTGGGPVALVNGVASFDPMSINLVGSGYTLTATSGALPTAASTVFNIIP